MERPEGPIGVESTVPTSVVSGGAGAVTAAVPANGHIPSAPAWEPAVTMPQEAPAAPAAPAWQQPSIAQHTNVNVNVGGPTIVVAQSANSVPLIARVMWYLFIGWWLAPLMLIAWLPADAHDRWYAGGLRSIQQDPPGIDFRPRTQNLSVNANGGVTTLSHEHNAQLPMWQRALYFLFVGLVARSDLALPCLCDRSSSSPSRSRSGCLTGSAA